MPVKRIINPDTYSDTFKTNQVVFAIFQIIYTYSVNKPFKWPRCRSAKVVTVVYGLPNMEAFEEAQAGKIVLGGCEVTDDDPSWQCLDCDAKIFRYNRFNEPLKAIPVKKTNHKKHNQKEHGLEPF